MTKKGLRIAARIVFGLLALASLIVCIYYIVKGDLSEVLSSMTLCLLSISLGYIYGRNEPEPEEGIVPADEKASVISHIDNDNVVILGANQWYLEGTDSEGKKTDGYITNEDGLITCALGSDMKFVIRDITDSSFTLKQASATSQLEIHAYKR